jgi:hypothetical protein
MVPWPSLRPPVQTADADFFMAISRAVDA